MEPVLAGAIKLVIPGVEPVCCNVPTALNVRALVDWIFRELPGALVWTTPVLLNPAVPFRLKVIAALLLSLK